MREKNLENKNCNDNEGDETATIGKNSKFVFEENIDNEASRNKYKEFSISKRDLYEGRMDNNLRTSKNRKPSTRVIESFNTVNRNSNNNILQLTHGNSSVNDTPNTEINCICSDQEKNNQDNNKSNNVYNHKYKYKYSNIALKKIDNINKCINSKNNNNIIENNIENNKGKK